MCNFLFNSLLSLHYNRCVNNASSSSSCSSFSKMTRRKSSPALPILHDNTHQDIKQAVMQHSAYCVAATTDDIDQVKGLLDDEQVESEEEDYDQFDDLDTRCGCGVVLTKGWACDNCRISCPGCNRSLTNDPQDFCSRCNSQCQEHGLYKNDEFESCPQCAR